MKYYKLTNAQDETYGCCNWGKNVEHTAPGKGDLCTNGWIHCYNHPVLAVMFNRVHANYDLETAHLWECEVSGRIKVEDRGMKFGVQKARTTRRINLPVVTTQQKVKFGILCVLKVCREIKFREWASRWLSGKDRTPKTARKRAAKMENSLAKWAVYSATWPTRWIQCLRATKDIALKVARIAESVGMTKKIDFIKIAEKAMEKDEG